MKLENTKSSLYNYLLIRAIVISDKLDYEDELTYSLLYELEQYLNEIGGVTPNERANLLRLIGVLRFSEKFSQEEIKQVFWDWFNSQILKVNRLESIDEFISTKSELIEYNIDLIGSLGYLDFWREECEELLKAKVESDFNVWSKIHDDEFYDKYFKEMVENENFCSTIEFLINNAEDSEFTEPVIDRLRTVLYAQTNIKNNRMLKRYKKPIYHYAYMVKGIDEVKMISYDMEKYQDLKNELSNRTCNFCFQELQNIEKRNQKVLKK